MARLSCPHCKNPVQVQESAAGKNVKCPKCTKLFKVPTNIAGAKQAAKQPAAAAAAGAAKTPTPTPIPAPGGGAVDSTPQEPTVCPTCNTPWTSGAIACMDCGYMLPTEEDASEQEAARVICANPACGVANPQGTRDCQRCNSPLPEAAGTMVLGRYRLEKLLKMGGFGAVYRASDTKNGNREVAIKDMIGSDPDEFKIRLNFFRREAEILRSLDKVDIVPKVYDFAEEGQRAHLVMEFIRGKDLLDLMEENRNKPFPIADVINWGIKICDVLTHMHRQKPPLIHRDLKPDNIMLLDDKKSIKMIDFGTARDLGKTVKERAAGKTRVYTEGYAPPEQIIGKPEPRSDLYALAATLYHLATGQVPEGHRIDKEIEEKLQSASPPWPKEYNWFFELIMINLNEDIKERYFSATEIKKDLQAQKITREVPCPKCKTVNPVRVPFCSKCAEALTEDAAHCNSCGKDNRMGSRFCIYCGNRIG